MKISTWFKGSLVLTLCVFANLESAVADTDKELEKAAEKACNRIVTCTKESLEKEGAATKEMLAIVDQFAAASCQAVFAYQEFVDIFDIKKDLLKCYTEIAEQSCEDFEKGEDLPACDALDTKFDNY